MTISDSVNVQNLRAVLLAALSTLAACVETPGIACGNGFCPNGYKCSQTTFQCVQVLCGDNVVEGNEVCDDGNNADRDGCSADCRSDETCGNGIIDTVSGEDCDDAGESTMCNSDCTPAMCGDGHLNFAAGEACDDAGESNACNFDCTLAVCGDGYINTAAGETCEHSNQDDGNTCSSDCQRHTNQIVAGRYHTCALYNGGTGGTVRCWGSGEIGQLGYGNENNIGDDEPPYMAGDVQVGGGVVVQIAAGGRHTCALLDSGNVRCWGSASDGQLGYGNTSPIGNDELPSTAGDVDVGGAAIQLAAGENHTCALLDHGGVRCWGDGSQGQLGYRSTDDVGRTDTPASAGDVNVGGTAIQLAAGENHTCALLDHGGVRCWGDGYQGQLGHGNTDNIGDDEHPITAGDIDVGGPVQTITAGGDHTCALLQSGHIRCWGDGRDGQLGSGGTADIGDDESPASTDPVNLGLGDNESIAQIVAGREHTCALLDTGDVRCWGSSEYGQLGYADVASVGDNEHPASVAPVDIAAPGAGTPVAIAAGYYHTCALLDNGNIRCWGYGDSGRLGYGNTNNIGDDEPPSSAGDVNF